MKILIICFLISLIIIILTVFYIFDIYRYLYLHIRNSTYLIENYSKLPKLKNNVKISFTATSSELNKIQPMINSILDQTHKVSRITLIIHTKYNINENELPDFIKNVCIIQPTGIDYGEETKLIPTLLKEKEYDTILIALDNNYIYGKDFIKTLLQESEQNQNNFITDKNNTFVLTKPSHFNYDIISNTNIFEKGWFLNQIPNKKIITYNKNYKKL